MFVNMQDRTHAILLHKISGDDVNRKTFMNGVI